MSDEQRDADSEKHSPVNYWWFEGESVEELIRQLNEAGASARLEVRPQGRKIMLHVLGAAGAPRSAAGEPINESHPCPPWC